MTFTGLKRSHPTCASWRWIGEY